MANPPKRCAIYTRKSSEEGLDQDFNSLHAQREACEAFIQSQVGEGWRLIRTAYDDGGFSGGTMERPGLERLLADIRRGLIDVVVVYKVDRLTRSLADFAKMVEVFDAQGVSFVAVTQQFNTTTSMGRLTLNVLLSFAQFEREVIGERIRDKVAASKRKGIWMGGVLPLGYDVRERRLVVNELEAQTVKHIFQQYLKLGCVRLLKQELDRRGIVSKSRVSRNGEGRGGKSFSRGALYHLLSNPVYLGEIRHKKERHPGQHEPIVNRTLWNHVQERLCGQATHRNGDTRTEAKGSPLAGKLFDERGEPLYVQGAAKNGRRYRYYVSKSLVRGESKSEQPHWRIPAPEIERIINAAVQQMLADKVAMARSFDESGIEPERLPSALRSAQVCAERLRAGIEAARYLADLTERVELKEGGAQISLTLPIGADEGRRLSVTSFFPVAIRRRGTEMRLVLTETNRTPPVNLPLLKTIARARRWAEELISGRACSIGEVAKREGVDRRSVRRLMRLAFLAPTIVEAIAEGRHRSELTAKGLTRQIDLPLFWRGQEQELGI